MKRKRSTRMAASFIMFLLLITGCNVDEAMPSGITAHYQLSTRKKITEPALLRYEVIWMGPNAYEATNRGVVSDADKSFAVKLNLPSRRTLENVRPIYTLSYNFHYLPEPPARRPRIVVYEDLNEDGVFNLNVDHIVALDGAGSDSHTAVIALEDADAFLSQLTPSEHSIYYGWTDDEYTAFIYAGASEYWSSHVYPIFENAYIDDAVANEPHPVMTLIPGPDILMRADLACYREVARTTTYSRQEMWVDSTLDAEKLCPHSDMPCVEFDAATTSPDIGSMANATDDFYTVCGWTDDGIEIIEAHRGFITCVDCFCEIDFYTTYFAFNGNNIPMSPTCPQDTPVPEASLSETSSILGESFE